MADCDSRIGVIAIGRNEGQRLLRCLASIDPGRIPVIYVDSASDDGSADAARRLGADVVELDMARPFTAARARSEGFARLVETASALEYVMFVDGDCTLEPGWLTAAATFLDTHPDFAVTCGRRRESDPAASLYNSLIDQEWNTPVGEAQACGGDALFRRKAYSEAGGFNPAMIAGEEPELCTRLRQNGWRIMRLDVPMTIHDAAMHHFGQWWRRADRSGMGYAQAWQMTRHSGDGGLYRRELARSLLWAGALPLAAVLAAVMLHPALLLVWPLLFTAQFLRMSLRGDSKSALLSVLGKYAEFIGIARYIGRAMRGKTGGTLIYK
jgi:GT2 family glycosyltransferase